MQWKTIISDTGWALLNQSLGSDKLVFTSAILQVRFDYDAPSGNSPDSKVTSLVTLTGQNISVVQQNGYTTIKITLTNRILAEFCAANNITYNTAQLFRCAVRARLESQNEEQPFCTAGIQTTDDYIYVQPPAAGESTVNLEIPLAISEAANVQFTTLDTSHVTQSELDAAVATAPVCWESQTYILPVEQWQTITQNQQQIYYQELSFGDSSITYPGIVFGLVGVDANFQKAFGLHQVITVIAGDIGPFTFRVYADTEPTAVTSVRVMFFGPR